jgi:5'-methylthioadenosine phosphorylase
MTEPVRIAVIGGSGLYDIDGLEELEERVVETPFGRPSDALRLGRLAGRPVAFLARHGRGHRYNPTQVPVFANLWALKSLGVFWVISISAVGSLKLEIAPRDFVIPDQLIDRTRHRPNTFYGELAVHVGFSHPFHPMLADVLYAACVAEGVTTHRGGTYVCMEGPMFSTKAESALYRSWGASVIGMTAIPEAKLAREAEMCYATIALATDYDVWHEEDHVDVETVIGHLKANVGNVRRVLTRAVAAIPLGHEDECDASWALRDAIMTDPKLIPPKVRDDLGIFLDKYLADRY